MAATGAGGRKFASPSLPCSARYVFPGDPDLSGPDLAGRPCDPVRRPDGRVVRGRDRNALVVFDTGEVAVVPGRCLRLTEKVGPQRIR